MKGRVGTVGVAILLLVGVSGFGTLVSGASAHTSPCHTQHTCPSDHHTYVWTDSTTGLGWDCARPGASEYDPSRDRTVVVYDGYTYYCRSAGGGSTTTATTLPKFALPDPAITPGAFNASVRQATIRKTICVSGWTKTIRPPVSYTNALKIQQIAANGEAGPASGYEEDHLIPLELGGAPRSTKNLWPEPRSQANRSDPLETRLKTDVCHRLITLAKARTAIRQFKFVNG